MNINRINIKIVILVLIILVGCWVRLFRLDQIPVALNGDEAGFGYNAYAILQSGKDEHGNTMPWVFKSFGDYKPPIFVYMLVPIIKVFGLTEFAVRLPVAVLSILLIVLVFLCAKEIFKKDWIGLISAFLVAISPWAIQFSRAGWEASVGLFFTTLAVYLFLISLRRPFFIYLSTLSFIIAFYSYHAEKLAVPLLIPVIFWIFLKKQVKRNRNKFIILSVILFVSFLPAIISFTNISGQSRARGSVLTEYLFKPAHEKAYLPASALVETDSNLLTIVFFHSRIVLSSLDMLSKPLAYISPANLFVYGDEVGRHSVEDFGVFYMIDAVFLALGVYYLIKKKKNGYDAFLISWLIIGALPAMITMDFLHTIRPILALPAIYILEGFGIYSFFINIKDRKRNLGYLFLVICLIFLSINFLRFIQSYFVYTPIGRADWWQYGYKQAVLETVKHQDRFSQVIVDSPVLYGNPYIFFLFYQLYDPSEYNQTVKREDNIAKKVSAVGGFDKYTFRGIYWPEDRKKPGMLFVGTGESLPIKDIQDDPNIKMLKEIKKPNGDVVFRIVETLPAKIQ